MGETEHAKVVAEIEKKIVSNSSIQQLDEDPAEK